jgi:peptidoglycan/LPS O-acetylase OafA/YrhL
MNDLNSDEGGNKNTRVNFLDGIRGWASLMVFLSHLIICFLALSTPEYNSVYLKFISDGKLAVMVFFVLSGYALSIGICKLNLTKRNLPLSAMARYFRLSIPILVTSIIAYALLKAGLFYNLEAATTPATSLGWLGTFYKFDASVYDLLKFSFFDVFFNYDAGKSYNTPLWTMPIEIFGSFFIYAYIGIFKNSDRVFWAAIIIIAAYFLYKDPRYACFAFGYIIFEINTKYPRGNNKFIELSSIVLFSSMAVVSTFYRPVGEYIITSLMATAIVLSVSYSNIMASFFTNKISRLLGKISFPLYLIQVPVICSFSSYLFIFLPKQGLDNLTSSNINVILTASLCFMLAWLLIPIENFSIRISKKIAKFALG